MAKRPQIKRALILNQDELDTLKNLINAAKIMVYRSYEGKFQGNEMKDLESTLNAFGKSNTWDNEKILDPKVKR
jgi:hypothetical protein